MSLIYKYFLFKLLYEKHMLLHTSSCSETTLSLFTISNFKLQNIFLLFKLTKYVKNILRGNMYNNITIKLSTETERPSNSDLFYGEVTIQKRC